MSKSQKTKTDPAPLEPTAPLAAAAAPAPQGEAAPQAAPQADPLADAAPKAASKPAALAWRVLELAQRRVAGTRAERLVKRVEETAERLPRRLQSELDSRLDALLNRVGLVRKSRTLEAAAPLAADSAPKAA